MVLQTRLERGNSRIPVRGDPALNQGVLAVWALALNQGVLAAGALALSRAQEVEAEGEAAPAVADLVAAHQLALHAQVAHSLVAAAQGGEVVPRVVSSPLETGQEAVPLVVSSLLEPVLLRS